MPKHAPGSQTVFRLTPEGSGAVAAPKRKKRSALAIILLVIGILLLLAAGVIGASLYLLHWQNQDFYQKIQNEAVAVDPVNPETNKDWSLDTAIDWSDLRKRNSDIVAWVVVPGTKIDYPVARTNNNTFYLHHNFAGQDSVYGCVFADYQGDPHLAGQVNIIYGHNMRDGSMFAGLNKFTDSAYLAKHKLIWLYTPQMTYQLEAKKAKQVNGASSTFRSRLSKALDPSKPKEYDFVTCWAPDDAYRVAILSYVTNQKVPTNAE